MVIHHLDSRNTSEDEGNCACVHEDSRYDFVYEKEFKYLKVKTFRCTKKQILKSLNKRPGWSRFPREEELCRLKDIRNIQSNFKFKISAFFLY